MYLPARTAQFDKLAFQGEMKSLTSRGSRRGWEAEAVPFLQSLPNLNNTI
jgi:hypothetical protein